MADTITADRTGTPRLTQGGGDGDPMKSPVPTQSPVSSSNSRPSSLETCNPKLETDTSRIIAFANQKGGSGKTTCAVNLSCALAAKGYSVLLIDIDPQSNSTVALGVNPADLSRSMRDILLDSRQGIAPAVLETQIPGLSLAPSTIELAGVEIELFHALGRETVLRDSLGDVTSRFHFIMIDCPPALGLLTINALTAASEVFIPVSLDFFALMGTRQLMNTIELIRERLNPILKVSGVIPTFYDARTNLSKEALAKLSLVFPENVFSTVIHNSVKLREAPGYGQPIVLYDPHSRAAEDYASLAEEVIARG